MSSDKATGVKLSKSIVFRFLIAFLILFTIGMVALMVMSTITIKSSLNSYLEEQLGERLVVLQTEISKKSKQMIGSTYAVVEAVTSTDYIKDTYVGITTVPGLLRSYASTSDFSTIYILDDNQVVAYTTDEKLASKTLFKNDKSIKSAAHGRPVTFIANAGGNISLLCAVHFDYPGVFSGFCVSEYKLTDNKTVDAFKGLVTCEVTVFIDDTRAATTITDSDGVTRLIGTKLNNDFIYDKVYLDEEDYYGDNIINGIRYRTVYSRIKTDDGSNAILFIGMPAKIADITRNKILYAIGPTILIICLLIELFVYVMLRRLFIMPLGKAQKAISPLANDDVVADLTYRLNFNKDDEIGILGKDIDLFLAKQQQMVIALKETEISLEKISSTLGTNSVETSSAIAQVMANIASVRKQTEHQLNAVKSASEEMAASVNCVNELEDMIENQSAGIAESSAAIEEMVGNIAAVASSMNKMNDEFKTLIDVTEDGRNKQNEVDAKVTEMSEQSRLLMEANAVISRIASQTNLLAMNAAIEAAHAGEAGAGFSVVADEIRSLAENSSKQSHNIGQELKQISQTINAVVATSQESKAAFHTIIEKLSDTDNLVREVGFAMTEQDNASRQVLEALRDINEATAKVQTTAKSMKDSTDKVDAQMSNVNQIATNIQGSMDEMSAGAVQINESAQHIAELATETHSSVQTMEGLIENFKVE